MVSRLIHLYIQSVLKPEPWERLLDTPLLITLLYMVFTRHSMTIPDVILLSFARDNGNILTNPNHLKLTSTLCCCFYRLEWLLTEEFKAN